MFIINRTSTLCHSYELFELFSQILSRNPENLKKNWSKTIFLSERALVLFTDWIISAAAYFFPSEKIKTPKRSLSVLVDTSQTTSGFVIVKTSTELATAPIVSSGSVPLPKHLINFGTELSSSPSSTLREVWVIKEALLVLSSLDKNTSPALINVWTDNLAAAHILTVQRSRTNSINQIISQILEISSSRIYLIRVRFHFRTQFLARIPDFLSNIIFPSPSVRLLHNIASKVLSHPSKPNVVKLNLDFLHPGRIVSTVRGPGKLLFVVPLGLHHNVTFRLIQVLNEFFFGLHPLTHESAGTESSFLQ